MVVRIIVVLLCCVSAYTLQEFHSLDHLGPSVSSATQADAVIGLIQRLLPDRANQFKVVVDPDLGPSNGDTFEIETTGTNEITVRGTTGVAAASAFHYYLKNYCHCHVSWSGDQLNVPQDLPIVQPKLRIVGPNSFRYYQNVCTVSYSFVWWDWNRWEREIDWMAMQGINLPLAFNGQESVYQQVFGDMGITSEELDHFFAGPAFLAWGRMGNLRGWGGPLPTTWHTNQVTLQHSILKRMREFGIIPVLPAFGGFVPKAFTRIYPKANVTRLRDWGTFNDTYCCSYLLSPVDPLFVQIGTTFVKTYIGIFGTDHIYNTDTFNEMKPPSSESSYLSKASKAVYDGLIGADKDAIWLMQGWLFQNSFWGPDQTKAYLQGVPLGKMLILDLFAEINPIYKKTNSFYGQPFIWCMLHNFGGNLGMYGAIDAVNQGPSEGHSFANTTMVGTGITPEGINQNYVMYEFMNEMGWRNQSVSDLQQWFEIYCESRYGISSSLITSAWSLLSGTVYNSTDGHKNHDTSIIVKRPSKHLEPNIWYDWNDVITAWSYMLNATMETPAVKNSESFRYDLVDVTREVLQDYSYLVYYKNILQYLGKKDAAGIRKEGDKLLELMDDMDLILSSNQYYLLGKWIKSATDLGTTQQEKDLYEYNARNQITLWGPTGEILDYANKMWGGLMKTYYKERWQLFIDMLYNSTVQHKPFDQNAFNKAVLKVETAWTFDKTVFPIHPQGDSVELCMQLYAKYKPSIDRAISMGIHTPTIGHKMADHTGNSAQDFINNYV